MKKAIILGFIPVVLFGVQRAAYGFEQAAHSSAFQAAYRDVRLTPLDITPSILRQLVGLPRLGAELAIYQTLLSLQSKDSNSLTGPEQDWVQGWLSDAGQYEFPVLLAARKVLELSESGSVAEGEVKPRPKSVSHRLTEEAKISQLIQTGDIEALAGLIHQIPTRFDAPTAKGLLIQASRQGMLAVSAVPTLAEHFGEDKDVQALLVEGLSSERYGHISAMTLARYGKQETLLSLHDSLKKNQLSDLAAEYARLALKHSGSLLDPLAALPLFQHPFWQRQQSI